MGRSEDTSATTATSKESDIRTNNYCRMFTVNGPLCVGANGVALRIQLKDAFIDAF